MVIIAIIIVFVSKTKNFTPCRSSWIFNFPRKTKSIPHQPLLTGRNKISLIKIVLLTTF